MNTYITLNELPNNVLDIYFKNLNQKNPLKTANLDVKFFSKRNQPREIITSPFLRLVYKKGNSFYKIFNLYKKSELLKMTQYDKIFKLAIEKNFYENIALIDNFIYDHINKRIIGYKSPALNQINKINIKKFLDLVKRVTIQTKKYNIVFTDFISQNIMEYKDTYYIIDLESVTSLDIYKKHKYKINNKNCKLYEKFIFTNYMETSSPPQYKKIQICNTTIKMIINNNDDAVCRNLNSKALGWEAQSLRLWYVLSKKSDIIIDIGSYTGIYSLFSSKINKNASIYAFEICNRNFKRLNDNIKENNCNNIKSFLKGVSDENGMGSWCEGAYTEVPNGLCSINYLATKRRGNQRGKNIEIIKIDDVITINENLKYLIKMDIEGGEDKALDGMEKLITLCKPHILIERDANWKHGIELLMKIKKKYNYNLFFIDDNDLKILEIKFPLSSDVSAKLRKLYNNKCRNFLFTVLAEKDINQVLSNYIF